MQKHGFTVQGFEFRCLFYPPRRPRASDLISLCFSFLICKTRTTECDPAEALPGALGPAAVSTAELSHASRPAPPGAHAVGVPEPSAAVAAGVPGARGRAPQRSVPPRGRGTAPKRGQPAAAWGRPAAARRGAVPPVLLSLTLALPPSPGRRLQPRSAQQRRPRAAREPRPPP